MTKVPWRSGFTKKDRSKGSIEFDVIYFVQTMDNENKFFAYFTGADQAALRENGLI